jgi:hypothetical protein
VFGTEEAAGCAAAGTVTNSGIFSVFGPLPGRDVPQLTQKMYSSSFSALHFEQIIATPGCQVN